MKMQVILKHFSYKKKQIPKKNVELTRTIMHNGHGFVGKIGRYPILTDFLENCEKLQNILENLRKF